MPAWSNSDITAWRPVAFEFQLQPDQRRGAKEGDEVAAGPSPRPREEIAETIPRVRRPLAARSQQRRESADRLYVLDWHRNLDPPCRRPGEPLTVTSDPTCNAARPRCGSCHQNLVPVFGYVTGGLSYSQAIPRAGAWRAPRSRRAWRHCPPRGGRRSRAR